MSGNYTALLEDILMGGGLIAGLGSAAYTRSIMQRLQKLENQHKQFDSYHDDLDRIGNPGVVIMSRLEKFQNQLWIHTEENRKNQKSIENIESNENETKCLLLFMDQQFAEGDTWLDEKYKSLFQNMSLGSFEDKGFAELLYQKYNARDDFNSIETILKQNSAFNRPEIKPRSGLLCLIMSYQFKCSNYIKGKAGDMWVEWFSNNSIITQDNGPVT